MKTLKAVLVGALIWMLGVSIYSASYFIPLLENLELQANIVLAAGLIPIAWLGAGIYFKKEPDAHAVTSGLVMVLTAVVLDALFTVPFLIIPYGGTYLSIFTSPAFWLIAFEYFLVIVSYPKFRLNHKQASQAS